jgi:conjugal transfer pilus assembly protein TraA
MKKSLALLLTLTGASTATLASQTGSEFSMLYDIVYNWSTGYLGRSIALIFLLVGLGVGVIRASIMGAVGYVAAAICLVVAPEVVDGILTTVI